MSDGQARSYLRSHMDNIIQWHNEGNGRHEIARLLYAKGVRSLNPGDESRHLKAIAGMVAYFLNKYIDGYRVAGRRIPHPRETTYWSSKLYAEARAIHVVLLRCEEIPVIECAKRLGVGRQQIYLMHRQGLKRLARACRKVMPLVDQFEENLERVT